MDLFLKILELIGTMEFAISGFKPAMDKRYDIFGVYVCGFAVAVGGGTLRDVMIGCSPFWLTDSFYVLGTIGALVLFLLVYRLQLDYLWAVLDTIGLAIFTVLGAQKTLQYGFPDMAAVIMGCITGCFGGLLRDIFLAQEPSILKRDVYASASLIGATTYCLLFRATGNVPLSMLGGGVIICVIRYFAIIKHLNLPKIDQKKD